jgi:SAM-dependent methyltransferase
MYDYFDVHRLTYLAFGWKQERESQIGRNVKIARDGVAFAPPQLMESWYVKEFHREETVDGRALRHYFDAMNKHFAEMRRVVRKGGVLIYALADSVRRGKRFELVEAAAEQMKAAGFGHIQIKYREMSNQRILPSKRDIGTGRFSSKGRAVEIEEALVSARA